MAPSKRSVDEDDDSDVAISHSPSQSSNTPQSGSRKRRRVSDGTAHSRDNEDSDVVSSNTTPVSDPEENLEDMDEEVDEDEEELAATQALRKRQASRGSQGNVAAECGILENVRLENFMCHENMEYDLGPLINFICGKNGSGKSAILTGIVLCLGGKASATNRGQSLKNFIKEGREQAIVTCKIKNQGSDAYLPEEYGNTIIIERHFSRSGGSGYKIKNERGRLISTKKGDLDEICDYFALQIDNPMNVLSQDMARQFISASNASEKYKFFVKGVQLEQLDQDYRLIEEQIENIEATIDRKRPDIKILENQMQQAKGKDELVKKKAGMRDKMKDIRRQVAWIQVRDQERICDDYKYEISVADGKIETAEAAVAQLDNAYQAADQAKEAATGAYTAAQTAHSEVNEEWEEMQARHNDAKQEMSNAQSELRAIKQAMKGHSDTTKARQGEIEREEQRLIEMNGGAAAARVQALEEARIAAQEARDQWQEHVNDTQRIASGVEPCERNMSDQQKDTETRRAEVDGSRGKLDELIKNKDRQDRAFQPTLPLLLRAIQQEKRWQKEPVGPLGRHVRLLRPEWSSILERFFGGSLESFFVTSKHDADLLREIARRVKYESPVITIGNSSPIDTRPNEPSEQFDTILRVLDIDNDLVRKQLVLAHSIEKTILVPDLAEASSTMYDGGRLRNVNSCFSFNPNDKRKGVALKYTKNGDPSQDPVDEWSRQPRMKTDIEAHIKLKEQAWIESKQELRASEQTLLDFRNKLNKARQALERHKRRSRELEVLVQGAEDEVTRLEDAIKDDNVENGKLEALKQALAEAQENYGLTSEQYKDAIVAYDSKKQQLHTSQRAFEELQRRREHAELVSNQARIAAQEADRQRAFDLQEKNNAIARVDDAKAERATMDERLQNLEQQVADFITQARNISERVNLPEGATQKSLETKYHNIRNDINNFNAQMGGSPEQIAEAARKATEAYKQALKDLRNLEEVSEKLKASLIERRERWKKFRSHISVRAKAQFTYLLSERSFRGKLITDHRQKLLELRVEPDITKKSSDGRSARTLSGGEKSFSQICLLLAIWEAMGSPIRCLDEFDVFMDAVNRNLSVNMLIQAARQSIGRQFLLISPGTKEDITRAPDVHVREVAPPERGQRTLVF